MIAKQNISDATLKYVFFCEIKETALLLKKKSKSNFFALLAKIVFIILPKK